MRDAQEMMQPAYVLSDFIDVGVVLIRHGENPFAEAEPGARYHRDDDGSSADNMLLVSYPYKRDSITYSIIPRTKIRRTRLLLHHAERCQLTPLGMPMRQPSSRFVLSLWNPPSLHCLSIRGLIPNTAFPSLWL